MRGVLFYLEETDTPERILTQTFHPTPSFESIVMVETITMAKQFATFDKSKNLIDGAKARRDTWETKEEAYEAMKKRVPWKVWDDRVLRQFVVSMSPIFCSGAR